jgi:glycine cleavage system aminomethyltransferase T
LWKAGESLGIVAGGSAAFDSLRLEKAYRLWGSDIHTEYNSYEAGLGFVVKLDKQNFIGKEALLQIKDRGISRKLCWMTLDTPEAVVMGKEPILDGEKVLGYVTSANYGYTVGKCIVMGYVPIEYSKEGTKVDVYYFGKRCSATVARPLSNRYK